jgi:gliding motility-associated-like protein
MPNLDSLGNALGVIVTASYWSPGTYLNDSTAANPWVYPITSTNYRLVALSQYGCADTAFTNITVYPAAVVNLGPDSVIISPGQSYQISPQTNCDFFLWYPPLGLDNINVSNPVATPTVNTTFIVNGATSNGCVVTDSIRIHVDPGTSISIPNAFTPGGNVNNTFMIIYKGAVGLNYFRIFDRWGNKVYESNNINAGWDGKYNGQPQPMGVYVYEVEAITSTGEVFQRVGNVTLVR